MWLQNAKHEIASPGVSKMRCYCLLDSASPTECCSNTYPEFVLVGLGSSSCLHVFRTTQVVACDVAFGHLHGQSCFTRTVGCFTYTHVTPEITSAGPRKAAAPQAFAHGTYKRFTDLSRRCVDLYTNLYAKTVQAYYISIFSHRYMANFNGSRAF